MGLVFSLRAGIEKSNVWLGYGLILVIGATLIVLTLLRGHTQTDEAWSNYKLQQQQSAGDQGKAIETQIDRVYESLRTISYLPSVQDISRHAENLSADGGNAIQQVYNNLSENVAVSEIYVLPADFNPERLDPLTGKFEEPIIMYDEFVVAGGKYAKEKNPFEARKSEGLERPPADEVEIHEYREMAQQIAWLKANFARDTTFKGFSIPMISSGEVTTCDNTVFNQTRIERDRKGIIFSVPYYRKDGEIGGMVSGIIRTAVLEAMLSSKSQSLTTPEPGTFFGATPSRMLGIEEWQPNLFAPNSKTVLENNIKVNALDPRGPWIFSAPVPSANFYASSEFKSGQNITALAVAIISLLTASILGWYHAAMRRHRAMQYAATHDGLTGIANRTKLESDLRMVLQEASPDKVMNILYLDLDRFKLINDTLGHHAGDEAIRISVKRIKECLDRSDSIARVGGDEFVVLQSSPSIPEIARKRAARLAQDLIFSLKQPFNFDTRQVAVGTSVGIAFADSPDETPADLLRKADLALSRAKQAGKGDFRFYEAAMDDAQATRRQLEADLAGAMLRDEFFLCYQPIMNMKTLKMVGVEALLRWQHPKRGVVPPLEFISLAESTGYILPLGEWVLQQACKDAANLPHDMHVAVNLSALQFQNPSLPLQVLTALNHAGLSPKRLELEVTESVLMANDKQVKEVLTQLRGIGVSMALDDFGTGYSAFSYLKEFEFDKLKIDKSFIADMTTERSRAILQVITNMSALLGMTTVAEGIETDAQFKEAVALGCGEAQGYLFSKPVLIEDIMKKASEGKKRKA